MVSYILAALTVIITLSADQYTKYFVSSHFVLGERRGFITGLIDLTYIQNTGGAWGMLAGNMYFLLAVTAAVMIVCVAMVIKFGKSSKLMLWAMTLVLSGGIGNLIDRVFRGSVVDFLHFEFYPSFPVFNIADCAIVIGAGLLILYFILDTISEAKHKKQLTSDNDTNEQN